MGDKVNNELLSQVFTTAGTDLDINVVLINLILTALTALAVRFYYVHYGRSLSNRSAFAGNFVIVATATMLIISVIKSSLALSLGLVGALSIVRFRTAIKETEELGYLFLMVCVGLGFGANQKLITVLSIGIILICISLNNWLAKRKHLNQESNVYVNIKDVAASSKLNLVDEVNKIFDQYADQIKLRRYDYNHESQNNNNAIEISYSVRFKDYKNWQAAPENIKKLSPNIEISYIDTNIS